MHRGGAGCFQQPNLGCGKVTPRAKRASGVARLRCVQRMQCWRWRGKRERYELDIDIYMCMAFRLTHRIWRASASSRCRCQGLIATSWAFDIAECDGSMRVGFVDKSASQNAFAWRLRTADTKQRVSVGRARSVVRSPCMSKFEVDYGAHE